MTILRIASLISWLVMAGYMAPGAWATITNKGQRFGDPMRLACFLTGILTAGFSLRWLLAPEDETAFLALYPLSIGVAAYILVLGRAYGRGPRV